MELFGGTDEKSMGEFRVNMMSNCEGIVILKFYSFLNSWSWKGGVNRKKREREVEIDE